MRYRITGLALEPAIVEDERRLADVLARVLSVDPPEIRQAVVIRHSLDARRRPARHIYSLEVDVPDAVTPRPRPPRGSSVRLVDAKTSPAALRADGVFASRTAISTFPPSFRPVVVFVCRPGIGPFGRSPTALGAWRTGTESRGCRGAILGRRGTRPGIERALRRRRRGNF